MGSRFNGVITGLAGVTSAMEEVRQKAVETSEETGRLAEAIPNGITVVDQLRERFKEFGENAWAKEMILQLDTIAVGAGSLEQFITLWGQAKIQTEEGMQTIRELLDGEDLNAASDQIQQLLGSLENTGDRMGAITEFLQQKGGFVADMLTGWITAYEGGKIKLEGLIQRLRQLQDQLPDGEFDPLVDAIEDALRDGLG